MRRIVVGMLAGVCALSGIGVRNARANLMFTEVMYNPASLSETNWEFIEVYNPGPGPVNLSGYVLDDDDGDPITAANIASGNVPAGGVAVLYSSTTPLADVQGAWGASPNFVPVTAWPSLNNTGDRLGIWSSLTLYGARDYAAALDDVNVVNVAPWPVDDGIGSVYLKNVTDDNSLGANWGLSTSGTGGAFNSNPAGTNLAVNAGSPGVVIGAMVPEPQGWGAMAGGVLALWGRFRRNRA